MPDLFGAVLALYISIILLGLYAGFLGKYFHKPEPAPDRDDSDRKPPPL
jgi:hypothetical protein